MARGPGGGHRAAERAGRVASRYHNRSTDRRTTQQQQPPATHTHLVEQRGRAPAPVLLYRRRPRATHTRRASDRRRRFSRSLYDYQPKVTTVYTFISSLFVNRRSRSCFARRRRRRRRPFRIRPICRKNRKSARGGTCAAREIYYCIRTDARVELLRYRRRRRRRHCARARIRYGGGAAIQTVRTFTRRQPVSRPPLSAPSGGSALSVTTTTTFRRENRPPDFSSSRSRRRFAFVRPSRVHLPRTGLTVSRAPSITARAPDRWSDVRSAFRVCSARARRMTSRGPSSA